MFQGAGRNVQGQMALSQVTLSRAGWAILVGGLSEAMGQDSAPGWDLSFSKGGSQPRPPPASPEIILFIQMAFTACQGKKVRVSI